MDCADEASWRDMEEVSVAILNLMRASMGSQWSLFKVDELESVKPVPLTTRTRTFCVRWRREVCLAGMPYRKSRRDKSSGNSAESCIVK